MKVVAKGMKLSGSNSLFLDFRNKFGEAFAEAKADVLKSAKSLLVPDDKTPIDIHADNHLIRVLCTNMIDKVEEKCRSSAAAHVSGEQWSEFFDRLRIYAIN